MFCLIGGKGQNNLVLDPERVSRLLDLFKGGVPGKDACEQPFKDPQEAFPLRLCVGVRRMEPGESNSAYHKNVFPGAKDMVCAGAMEGDPTALSILSALPVDLRPIPGKKLKTDFLWALKCYDNAPTRFFETLGDANIPPVPQATHICSVTQEQLNALKDSGLEVAAATHGIVTVSV